MAAKNLVGRTIAGKYSLDALVGEGGFGAVYRATHHPLGRTVAVKISLHGSRGDLHARFIREARIQSALRHPACVLLLDFGEEDGLFYMVQDFVEGRTLSEILRAEGPLPVPRAAAIVCDVLELLDAAHRLGIVHRDIKPGNIMLTDIGEQVRVLDFGIAKLLDEDSGADLTRTGATVGTPSFMAPEQIRQGPIEPATDIYATGATLYRLCAGHGPFVANAPFDILRMQLEAPAPRLPFEAPVLDAVIARAMAKMPRARFPSAAAMRSALAALDPDATYPSLPPTFVSPAFDATSAHGERYTVESARPSRLGWAALGGLVLLGSLGGALMQSADEPGPVPRVGAGQAIVDPRAEVMVFERAVALEDHDLGAGVRDARPTASASRDGSPADAGRDAAPPPPERAERTRHVRKRSTGRRRADRPRARPVTVEPAPVRQTEAERAEQLADIVGRHLLACRCDAIAGPLAELVRSDPDRARPLRAAFEDECRARLPDNCLARAGR